MIHSLHIYHLIGQGAIGFMASCLEPWNLNPLHAFLFAGEPLLDNPPVGGKDRGPMGLGRYNSLREYCSPLTASSVFLILILIEINYSLSCDNTPN